MHTKRANQSDYECMKRIHHSAYKEMVIAQFGEWDEKVQDEFFISTWNRQPFEIILDGEQIVGFCSIGETEDKVELLEFAIDIKHQGRGLGSLYLNHFKSYASSRKKKAHLNVMKTNLKAKALYERAGFEVFGENHFQYLLKEKEL